MKRSFNDTTLLSSSSSTPRSAVLTLIVASLVLFDVEISGVEVLMSELFVTLVMHMSATSTSKPHDGLLSVR